MRRLHRARWGSALERWLDGEGEPDAAERVVAHLERCPDCVAVLDRMIRIRWALGRQATPVASTG